MYSCGYCQVNNHEELRLYAARQTIEALKRGANHESMVAIAAAIVGASSARAYTQEGRGENEG